MLFSDFEQIIEPQRALEGQQGAPGQHPDQPALQLLRTALLSLSCLHEWPIPAQRCIQSRSEIIAYLDVCAEVADFVAACILQVVVSPSQQKVFRGQFHQIL